ncbi:MAG: ribosomal-processing cysteine protease Prp, partial [Clostridiales bacterium]|nr:ribosomal-processing cysteine protease Prp [Clostridiales bacterium]
LVCCSVSVLTINLVNIIESFTDEEFYLLEEEELGLVQVTFKGLAGEKADVLMRSYELGVQSIADEYDTWLKVITKEV